jgi:PAS domain S-box-containing protein
MSLDTTRPAAGAERRASGELKAARLPDRGVMLDLLLEATQDGILDWDLVSGVEAYNPRFLHLFGFDDESVEDRPRNWRDLVHPDDAQRAARELHDHLEEGWPFVTTLRMRHYCGGYRTILLRGAAQRDTRLRPLRVVIIFSDISERVELEERHVALAQALPDTLFRVSRAGRVLELKRGSDHAQSPFQKLELGLELEACLPAAVVAGLSELFSAPTTDTGTPRHLELATPIGPATAVHHEVCVVKSGEDEWVCIARDVSERHTFAERLLQSEKLGAIGQLAAGVAHEINTPMQFIGDNLYFAKTAIADLISHGARVRGLVDEASRSELGGNLVSSVEESERDGDIPYVCEELPRAIERSLDGIARVTTIVRALKTFAHPGGREMAAVDLGRLIDSTVAVATNEWKLVAVVDVAIDPLLPAVRCAGGEISQVLLNLVLNAAHAIADRIRDNGDKGRISIAARRLGDDCEIRIRDTGTGIPEHARSKVFEPFFTTKEVGKGTGQGLAIAHSLIVGHHRGSIRFETELGVGTTFILTIPLAGATDDAPNAAVA